MSELLNGRGNGTPQRKLRITFVLLGRSLNGGVRVVVTYANRLMARGHTVTIACLRQPLPRRPKALVWRLYRDFVSETGIQRDHLHDFRGEILSAPAKRPEAALPDGDVVIATHWKTADPVVALPASKGRKFYFLQGYEVHYFDPARVDATWRLPMRKILISTWLEAIARTRFGDESGVLIPNAVESKLFDAPPRKMHRPPTVGVMYSTEPPKGVKVAFEAIELVRRSLPDVRVVSFGSERPTRVLPMPENSTFYLRPPQHRIAGIYASADVWLLPSASEGFGLPALEAMACRCPVVSTRCGGPDDFVEDGVNGFLVEVGDTRAMADRIRALLSDPACWERMSAAAYRVHDRFDWDRSTELFEGALSK